MFKMANRMGKSVLYDSLKEFGFGAKTEVGLSGESKGIFRNVSKWAQIDVATHSFGQGISVTALQMMQAYGALANGGMLMRPKIFISENEESGVRVLKESTAAQIRTALNLVTEDAHGTGKNSRIPGVPVFGKTGTAQKAKAFGRGYDSSKVLASFIGFVDGHSIGVPRTLVAYIAVDEPGVTPRWGGTLAAPVFRKVLERSLSYLLSNDSKNKPQIAVGKSQGNLKPLS
jgi:cell division protein FtsI/penicillin-binding protein 2